jgi:hypothetical protein
LLDIMMVIVLWIGGIISRLSGIGAWSAVGIWLVIALSVAFLMNWMQPQPSEVKPLPQ